MNYKKHYILLIHKRQKQILPKKVYSEKHHILPKSLYPEFKNEKDNIVRLTAREHYVAHQLLYYYYRKTGNINAEIKMAAAWFRMCNNVDGLHVTNRQYETAKKAFSQARIGQKLSKEICQKISKSLKGKTVSEEIKKKISEAQKGKHHSDEARKKCGEKNKGKHLSEEHKKKISESSIGLHKGRIWINNGSINKFVYPDEIPEGFVKGRLKNKQK